MFDLPDAKRVKRSKLFSSISSGDEASDAEPQSAKGTSEKKLETSSKRYKTSSTKAESTSEDTTDQPGAIDYGFDYEFIDKVEAPTSTASTSTPKSKPSAPRNDAAPTSKDPQDPLEQTYAFNLFAPPPKPSASTTGQTTTEPSTGPSRITIRSPTPPSITDLTTSSAGRILKPRPQTHYFTSALPPQILSGLKSEYTSAAISASSLLHISTQPWPGTHLPWRTIAIPTSKLAIRHDSHAKKGDGRRSRPRPSKRRRIVMRQRLAAKEAVRVTSQREEEAEREKRTRRNREKKVKRRMREKAKKAEVSAASGVGGDGDANKDGETPGD